MIFTKQFYIGRLMKTGSDAVKGIAIAVFEAGLEPNFTVDDPPGQQPHPPMKPHPYIVLGFRRLPCWALSRAQHAVYLGGYDLMPAEEVSRLTIADTELRRMTAGFTVMPSKWIRCEHLRADLIELFEKFYGKDFNDRLHRVALNCPTKAKMPYDHDVFRFFTKEQVRILYEGNPRWSAFEMNLYGKLMI